MILKKSFLLLTFTSAWIGLAVILYSTITKDDGQSNSLVLANFLSYFTTQSNILVGIVTGILLFNNYRLGRVGSILVFGALVNISITFIVYQLILSSIWDPKGLEFIGDLFIHTITPILYILYWGIFHKKKLLDSKIVFYWLTYPILYITYTFWRGPIVDFYPYPFIDVRELSTERLILNVITMTLLFLVVSFIFVGVNNRVVRSK